VASVDESVARLGRVVYILARQNNGQLSGLGHDKGAYQLLGSGRSEQ
jgi:hypothetical protein